MAINWDAIGAVGEILGAIAVFVSILYLALQIRRNTIAQQGSTHHQFLNTQASANRVISGSAEVCELIDRANKDFSAISDAEMIRLTFVFYDHFNQWEFAFDTWRKDLLDEDIWHKENHGYIAVANSTPSFCDMWSQVVRHSCSEEFRAHVDQVVATIVADR